MAKMTYRTRLYSSEQRQGESQQQSTARAKFINNSFKNTQTNYKNKQKIINTQRHEKDLCYDYLIIDLGAM